MAVIPPKLHQKSSKKHLNHLSNSLWTAMHGIKLTFVQQTTQKPTKQIRTVHHHQTQIINHHHALIISDGFTKIYGTGKKQELQKK